MYDRMKKGLGLAAGAAFEGVQQRKPKRPAGKVMDEPYDGGPPRAQSEPYQGGASFMEMGQRKRGPRPPYTDEEAARDGGEDGPGDDYGGEGMADGWSEEQRALRDEIEADQGGPELYEDTEAWKRKWLQRARARGMSEDEARRVLDSIGDFDDGGEG